MQLFLLIVDSERRRSVTIMSDEKKDTCGLCITRGILGEVLPTDLPDNGEVSRLGMHE
jgi:hypothetical protein